MTDMPENSDEATKHRIGRVKKTLLKCAEWSRLGRHRKVLGEVERMLPSADGDSQLEARLLIWKAQALMSMGSADRALPAASRSWDLEASPHACHLMSNALNAMGEAEEGENMLRMGWGMFPEAANLPVQLAMVLTDQGRIPEALTTLEDIDPSIEIPGDLEVFLFGLRANLMASIGRWEQAEELLRDGIDAFPQSDLLHEAHDSLTSEWNRAISEQALVVSWERSLTPLDGVAAEVDDAICSCGSVCEAPRVLVLAARRLWRSFDRATGPRPQAPKAWAMATLLAVTELDGDEPSAAAMARAVGARPATVRSALRRIRSYLSGLEPELARRSFAARTNPRLDENHDPSARKPSATAVVVPFPSSDPSGDC